MGDDDVDWTRVPGRLPRRAGRASSRTCCRGRWPATTRRTAGSPGPSRRTRTTVLDLACGSGPMSPGAGPAGADGGRARPVERDELALAAQRGPGPLGAGGRRSAALPRRLGRRGDQLARTGGACSPLGRSSPRSPGCCGPGGVLAAIAPASGRCARATCGCWAGSTRRLRTKPQFPGPVELAGFKRTLGEHGMRRVEDTRERYRFTVRTGADAELVMSALYLPQTRWSRVEARGRASWRTGGTGEARWRWPSRCAGWWRSSSANAAPNRYPTPLE